jgi:hypothetical protein
MLLQAFPAISSLLGITTLLGMLLHWIINTDRTIYVSIHTIQTIAFISNIAADDLKPLFITSSIVSSLLFSISFTYFRYERPISVSILKRNLPATFSILLISSRSLGLCLLSVFDIANHAKLYRVFLILFITGSLVSGIFVYWEHYRLGESAYQFIMENTTYYGKYDITAVPSGSKYGFLVSYCISLFVIQSLSCGGLTIYMPLWNGLQASFITSISSHSP